MKSTPERPTAEELAEWQRLADAYIGQSFWEIEHDDGEEPGDRTWWQLVQDGTLVADFYYCEADARFCQAARTAVPALLETVAEQEARLADLRMLLDQEAARAALLDERLETITPLARAAVALVNSWWRASGEEAPHGELVTALEQAVVALPDDLRSELEAPDGDADRG